MAPGFFVVGPINFYSQVVLNVSFTTQFWNQWKTSVVKFIIACGNIRNMIRIHNLYQGFPGTFTVRKNFINLNASMERFDYLWCNYY